MLNLKQNLACMLLSAGVCAGSGFAANNAASPDNSKVNQRDDGITQPTADQQTSDKQDVEVVRKIRQAIVADHSLSTYAHNIKIITQGGSVVLRGPVRSMQEKRLIEQKAVAIVGKDKVENKLEISAK